MANINVTINASLSDQDAARNIEQFLSIERRFKRRMANTPVVVGQDPFEEPGFVPAAHTAGPPREYAIPSKLLLFFAKERYTVVDFVPTIGGALMYENMVLGTVIVVIGMAAKWWTNRQIARYL